MKSQTRQRTPGHAVPTRDREAFTRLELAVVIAVLGLVAVLTLPALANQRERSTRVSCVNNLRLIGQGLQQWGTEHGGQLPWRTPWCEGGTFLLSSSGCSGDVPSWSGLNQNSWFQWAWVSNELRSPNTLACPSDAQKTPATLWASTPSGGFMHPNYRNKAVSYLAGLDVFPQHPQVLLAGDRNVRFNQPAGTCSSGISPVPGLSSGPVGSFGIRGGLHVEAGNYLFTDGRVEELSSQAFGARLGAIFRALDDNGSQHYLLP